MQVSDLEKCRALTTPNIYRSSSPQSGTVTLVSTDSLPAKELLQPANPCPTKASKRKSYLIVIGAFLSLLFAFGQLNSFGTYLSFYSTNQFSHLPPSTISWIGSVQLWVVFFSGAPIGCVFDRLGPTLLMLTGTMLFATSMVLTSFCKEYYQYILSQGVLCGISVGLLFYPALASVSLHFSEHRATAIGIVTAGSSVGGIVYPLMLQFLFQRIGFSWGVRAVGLIDLVGCAVATILVCTSASTPKRMTSCLKTSWFDIKSIFDTPFVLLCVGSSFVALGIFIPFFYLPTTASHLPISTTNPHFPFILLAILNASGVLGRIAPAYLADKLGTFNILFPTAFFSGFACLVIWINGMRSVWGTVLFVVVYGFMSGAFISVMVPCVGRISGDGKVGRKVGMLYTVTSVPSLVGSPIAGELIARFNGSFIPMIVFAGSVVIAGSFVILLARFSVERKLLARV